jgi:hypothetical protein
MLNVIETVEVIIDDYYRETGLKPAGIILGPTEYLRLCKHLEAEEREEKVSGFYLTYYRSIPLYVKEHPGIDIMIPYTQALNYIRR